MGVEEGVEIEEGVGVEEGVEINKSVDIRNGLEIKELDVNEGWVILGLGLEIRDSITILRC